MVKVIYKQSNKIALALLAISSVISGYVSTASSSTATQQQVGAHTGSASSSSDPVVQPMVACDQHKINVILYNRINGNEFSLALPAHATTYDLYRAAERAPESKVDGGIGITSGGEQIPNYLYPTNKIRLTDLGITNNTTLGYVRMEHNSYQLHPDDTTLDEASITRAIHALVTRRRLTQPYNTQEPIIHYPNSVEYSSDGENWCRLDKDAHIFMELRCVEDRSNPRQTSYVVATPAFVCDGDGPQYVQHLYMNKRSLIKSGHEFHTMDEYLNTEDLHPFAELKLLIPAMFGYEYYADAVRDDHSGPLAPSHIYKVNTNDLNHLWNILSAYYITRGSLGRVEPSPKHDQILKTLLQNIGITYDLEFHNLLLEESGGGGEFSCSNELNPGEAQWLRLAFRGQMEPCSAAGRIYVRNNVGGQPACFVTLHPLRALMNA